MENKKIKLPSGLEVEFNLPDLDKTKELSSAEKHLMEWTELVNKSDSEKNSDVWSTINGVNGRFKNLRIVGGFDPALGGLGDSSEISINYVYDKWSSDFKVVDDSGWSELTSKHEYDSSWGSEIYSLYELKSAVDEEESRMGDSEKYVRLRDGNPTFLAYVLSASKLKENQFVEVDENNERYRIIEL